MNTNPSFYYTFNHFRMKNAKVKTITRAGRLRACLIAVNHDLVTKWFPESRFNLDSLAWCKQGCLGEAALHCGGRLEVVCMV